MFMIHCSLAAQLQNQDPGNRLEFSSKTDPILEACQVEGQGYQQLPLPL